MIWKKTFKTIHLKWHVSWDTLYLRLIGKKIIVNQIQVLFMGRFFYQAHHILERHIKVIFF